MSNSVDKTWEQMEAEWDARSATKRLRASRPWAFDIARALPHTGASLTLRSIYGYVQNLRGDTKLPTPRELEATVRKAIYEKRGILFTSPRRGHWALIPEKARAWLIQHEAEFLTEETDRQGANPTA